MGRSSKRHARRTLSRAGGAGNDYHRITQRKMTTTAGKNDDGPPSDGGGDSGRKRTGATVVDRSVALHSTATPPAATAFPDDGAGAGGDPNALILPPRKKKNKKSNDAARAAELTPEEIRTAKLALRERRRKLSQIETRRTQKRTREDMYERLRAHAISDAERAVLTPSSEGMSNAKKTKRGTLRRLRGREMMGGALALSAEERGMLYTTTTAREIEAGDDARADGFGDAAGDGGDPTATGDVFRDGRGRGPREDEEGKEEAETDTGEADDDGDVAGGKIKWKRAKKKKKVAICPPVDGGRPTDDEASGPATERRTDTTDEGGAPGTTAGRDSKGTGSDNSDRSGKVERAAGDASEREGGRAAASSASSSSSSSSQDPPPVPSTSTDGGNAAKEPGKKASFADLIMSNLSTLREGQDRSSATGSTDAHSGSEVLANGIEKEEDQQQAKQERYVPPPPAVLKSAATLRSERERKMGPSGSDARRAEGETAAEVENTAAVPPSVPPPLTRPEGMREYRYASLPMCEVEYDIVDAVRNNDVVLVCGETGSGKSTQVPQFLYEAGFTVSVSTTGDGGGGGGDRGDRGAGDGDGRGGGTAGLLIGVTQPRRVAAVSTAKRVAYEMGCGFGGVGCGGDGESSSSSPPRGRGGGRGNGNLVAYQTRYESAGLGRDTAVKFMTDGVLLSEIRSDLLLRKYSVVVLDEAHERNLNTDVLLGLLSGAIPLRRRAASEGGLPPLRVVIMSATLRVEDFVSNPRLFAYGPGDAVAAAAAEAEAAPRPPVVIRVPGRTFPVTIHHSKVTELDDYETLAFRKVCRIHRKLPEGGILVFLTGKQEILRMVRRLKGALNPRRRNSVARRGSNTVLGRNVPDQDRMTDDSEAQTTTVLRDLDDDEVDGDLFQSHGDRDDYDDLDESDDDNADGSDAATAGGNESGVLPSNDDAKVHVLPLYSMLSVEEQARVFAPVPEGHRLIVCATNVAETSLTIPNISYVVDTGRRKCRNYHAGTGVASYDVMWISRAAADQRAGRAGRTGPGHCYRLYSSSLYSRHMDEFDPPEVLTRPLEDVILAMKAMDILDVKRFPFPTPPGDAQVNAATKLLASIGCIDVSRVEELGGDGRITRLGRAVAQLPLGVRYGKMLLVGAEAKLLDYAIAIVSVLSERSPFFRNAEPDGGGEAEEEEGDSDADLDEVDKSALKTQLEDARKERQDQWMHQGGDVLAGLTAIGAYSYAGRGAGGASEVAACKRFCRENGLDFAVMQRVQKLRLQLARLMKLRMGNATGVAAKTGAILHNMPPPNRLQQKLLRQAITSGLLDNVARLAPPGSIHRESGGLHRFSYVRCNAEITEPLFIDRNSTLYSRDFRRLPEWVCYDSIVRKMTKDSTVSIMTNVTVVDPSWLGRLAEESPLLSLGMPLDTPSPKYDKERDAVVCSVMTKYGTHRWHLPPLQVNMYELLQGGTMKSSSIMSGDTYRWFGRFLLEGKAIDGLSQLPSMLSDAPAIITRKKPVSKVVLFVSALSSAGVDNASALRKHWAENDNKFLFKELRAWTKKEFVAEVKSLWVAAVKENINLWRKDARCSVEQK